jgi:hypothetical protein
VLPIVPFVVAVIYLIYRPEASTERQCRSPRKPPATLSGVVPFTHNNARVIHERSHQVQIFLALGYAQTGTDHGLALIRIPGAVTASLVYTVTHFGSTMLVSIMAIFRSRQDQMKRLIR